MFDFKKLLKCKFHLRFILNPIVRYQSNLLGNYKGVCDIKHEIPIIVSITSYEDRFNELELSLYSLFNQSLKPDKIILWLSDKYNLTNLPYCITKYLKNGLEIRFVKDIGSYTKIIYALKEFSNSIIVTADDDIYYPKTWLKKLYLSYIANPNDIQVHRAHKIILDNDNNIMPYEVWEKHTKEENADYNNFLTGVGGVLYPPNCFTGEVFRQDLFLKFAPSADDIWLWFMALLSDRKIRVVKNHIKTLTCINLFRQLGIDKSKSLYSVNQKGYNDVQINNLMKLYGPNIINKLMLKK